MKANDSETTRHVLLSLNHMETPGCTWWSTDPEVVGFCYKLVKAGRRHLCPCSTWEAFVWMFKVAAFLLFIGSPSGMNTFNPIFKVLKWFLWHELNNPIFKLGWNQDLHKAEGKWMCRCMCTYQTMTIYVYPGSKNKFSPKAVQQSLFLFCAFKVWHGQTGRDVMDPAETPEQISRRTEQEGAW